MKKTKLVLLALTVILVFSMSACVPVDAEGGNEASPQVSDAPEIALKDEEDQSTGENPGMDAESAESAESAENAESAESAESAENAESAESAESTENAESAESTEKDGPDNIAI